MVADMSFCIWMEEHKKYWRVLPKLQKLSEKSFEERMFTALGEEDLDVARLKACFFERKYRDAFQYHLGYADYLKAQSLPILFVGGEVFVGPVSLDEIREAIGRALKVPTAGVWR